MRRVGLYSTAAVLATLLPSGAVAPADAAPLNLIAPTISGTPTVGETLTRSPGSWSGYPSPTITGQWKRNGVAISGATGLTYTLVLADLGATITVTGTATNGIGSPATADSNSLGPVADGPAVPVNTAAPSIMGTPEVGQELMYMPGTWTGNPTPAVVWQWTSNGVDISGETGEFLTLTSAELADTISGYETATNSQGSDTEPSSNTLGPVSDVATSLSSTSATQTSIAGTSPFTFTVAMGADIYEGYFLDIERTTLGSGDYSTTTLDMSYPVSPSDYATKTITAGNLVAAGYAAPPSNIQFWQRMRWRRQDGVAGVWVELTDTINASTAQWFGTDGVNRSSMIDLSGAGLIATIASSPGAPASVRATQPADGDRYFEVTMNVGVNSNGTLLLGVIDGPTGEVLGPSGAFPTFGRDSLGFGLRFTLGSTAASRYYNATTGTAAALTVALAAGDMFGIRFNTDTNAVTLYHRPTSTGVWTTVTTFTMTSGIPAEGDWYAASGAYAATTNWTVNFGATPFSNPSAGPMYG